MTSLSNTRCLNEYKGGKKKIPLVNGANSLSINVSTEEGPSQSLIAPDATLL